MILIIKKYVQGTFLIYLYPLHQVTGLKNCVMAYASTKYPSIFCHITATGYAHTTLVPIAGSGAIIADIIAAIKLTVSTGGETVYIANIETKAFILKCFARSTSIITISTVVIAVHVITRILLSHLGIIFCMGYSASLSSIVGIFCPSVPIVSINLSKSTG